MLSLHMEWNMVMDMLTNSKTCILKPENNIHMSVLSCDVFPRNQT